MSCENWLSFVTSSNKYWNKKDRELWTILAVKLLHKWLFFRKLSWVPHTKVTRGKSFYSFPSFLKTASSNYLNNRETGEISTCSNTSDIARAILILEKTFGVVTEFLLIDANDRPGGKHECLLTSIVCAMCKLNLNYKLFYFGLIAGTHLQVCSGSKDDWKPENLLVELASDTTDIKNTNESKRRNIYLRKCDLHYRSSWLDCREECAVM